MKQEDLHAWALGGEDAGVERALIDDPALAEEAYATLELDAALREAAKPVRRAGWAPRRWALGLAAAAAVAFAVLGPLRPERASSPRLRGESGSAFTLLAPSGTQSEFPARFTWRASRPTSTYRWELYDAQARARAAEVVADTFLSRAASLTPTDSVGTWRWLVVEVRADGSEGATSPALHFEVRDPE